MEARQPIAAPRRSTRSLRSSVVRVHRWLGILAAAFWFVQAATGILSLFHWELEDASVSLLHAATDLDAIEARLEVLAPAGSGRRVSSVWTTAGLPDRYDVAVVDNATDASTSFRIAGDGAILRTSVEGERSFFGTVVGIHHNLLLGETGSWIVGASGMLLLTNILLGLRAAWPRRGKWLAALSPGGRGSRPARLFQLHRALGLMAAIPALIFLSAGTCLVFQEGMSSLVGAQSPSLQPLAWQGRDDIGFARAARAALQTVDGSRLTMLSPPTPDDATYRLRILMPGELRRAYGTSIVFVAAQTGRVRAVFPAADAEPPLAFMNSLYAVHTGEALGMVGRLINLAIALWLATMTVLGLMLWSERRRVRRSKAAAEAARPAAPPRRMTDDPAA